MRTAIAISVALAAVVSASTALAQNVPTPAAPKPAPEMSQLAIFNGTWSCAGNYVDTVFGPAHPEQTLVTGSTDLNGFWMLVRYTEIKTGSNPAPATGVYQYGYDQTSKQFLANWTDSDGGWGTQTSAGWQNNKLVLAGDYNSNGQKIGARDTFEQMNPTTMSHVAEMQAMGQWVPIQSETCIKQ